MATLNPFDLLGDDDTEDPSQFIAAAQQKVQITIDKKGPASAQPAKPVVQAKLPSKPLPPAQAVRETRNEGQRGGRGAGRGDFRGRGRGRGRGFDRDVADNENAISSNNGYSGGYNRPSDDGDARRTGERRSFRGGFRRRGGFTNGEDADGERPPRRMFDRHSGTGRGNEFKREGSGRGNWGTSNDDIAPETEEPVTDEKNVKAEKQSGPETTEIKDSPVSETEEKKEEPEDKEMTLEEYEKLLGEKRKGLLDLKSEERKVEVDAQFKSMQLLSNKKNDGDIFIRLGPEKDKRKEAAEKAKKSVSINEFLKPAEGDNNYRSGGRGRGRGRGRGGYGGNISNVEAPKIEDVGQFPSLGAK